MTRQLILAWVVVLLGALPAWAEHCVKCGGASVSTASCSTCSSGSSGASSYPSPFIRGTTATGLSSILPTRSALSRVGLQQCWFGVVPLTQEEQLQSISQSEGLFFAQTNRGYFHAYDAYTGKFLWSVRLGNQSARALPASTNTYAVFVTNMNKLFMIDRRTGSVIWTKSLPDLPTSPTTCDEDKVIVSLANGKIYAYNLKVPDAKRNMVISPAPVEAWNWQTDGIAETRALPAQKMVTFGSGDGKVYVVLADERAILYRIATGGAIGAGLASIGTRMLLAPSADNILYAIDLFTAQVLWTFPSGAPILQEPLVAGNEIFVVNSAGMLSSIDPANGTAKWTTSTQEGRLLSIGEKRIYLESQFGDLFVIDRATGQTIADPRATLERAGLNLRPYELAWTNRTTDRIYFGSNSGYIICLCEIDRMAPYHLHDPKALPFGYIPREGIVTTPPTPTPAAIGPAPAPGEEKPAAGEEKPAEPGAAAEVPAPDAKMPEAAEPPK